MIVLALDAATDRLSVAVGEPGAVRARRSAIGARRHAALLTPAVLETLGEAGATLADLNAVAVSNGPGSFTGLRVAAAWAKAIVRAQGIPLYTASTLLVRAAGSRQPPRRTQPAGPSAEGRVPTAEHRVPRAEIVLALGSALRGELYAAAYEFAAEGPISVVMRPTVVAPAASLPVSFRPDLIVADLPAERIRGWPWAATAPVVGGSDGLPDAAWLIELIGVRGDGGAEPVADPARWEPEYGRPAEAQARWEREHGRSLGDPARVG